MLSVLLGLHFILALAIIGLILLQKHDSDGALGTSGGGAASGMFSVRGQANILTKSTAILMTVFIVNCLVMAKIVKRSPTKTSVIDQVAEKSIRDPKPMSEEEKESNVRQGLTPDGKPMPRPPSDLSKLRRPGEEKKATAAKNADKATDKPTAKNDAKEGKDTSKASDKKPVVNTKPEQKTNNKKTETNRAGSSNKADKPAK